MNNQFSMDFPVQVEGEWVRGELVGIELYFIVKDTLIPFPDELYDTISDWTIKGLKEKLLDQKRSEQYQKSVDKYIVNNLDYSC